MCIAARNPHEIVCAIQLHVFLLSPLECVPWNFLLVTNFVMLSFSQHCTWTNFYYLGHVQNSVNSIFNRSRDEKLTFIVVIKCFKNDISTYLTFISLLLLQRPSTRVCVVYVTCQACVPRVTSTGEERAHFNVSLTVRVR